MDRKLTAILAADVVGYSRMMGADEAATIAVLQDLRAEVFGPILTTHHGSIIKSMGDGWLVAFSSAVAAVNAAMQIQDRLRGHDRISLRIGVHIGDIARDDYDVYGDGINIAARLEALAPAGGILISDPVHASLDGTLSPSFEAAGTQRLKNIARPVVTWVRAPHGGTARPAQTPAAQPHSALPSLTIQPTANSDPRAEVLDIADALTADLNSYFGSINWLETQISSADNASGYTLRPTLRARGDRLRLETRLHDPDGATIWTHKSDSTLDDAFDWQDAVVSAIADHCIGMILQAETTRIAAIPDDKLTAEQCMLMGIMTWRDFSLDSFVRSAAFHDRAIRAKPDMADAYAEGLMVLMAARTMTSNPNMAPYLAKMSAWVEAGRPIAAGNASLIVSIAIATYMQDLRAIPLKDAVAQALRMAPFDARILCHCGWANLWCGQTQDAFECFRKSMEFGRLGPFFIASVGGAASASHQLGRDKEALSYVEQGLALSDVFPTFFSVKASALAHLDRLEEAKTVLRHYRMLEPDRTIKLWKATNNYGGSEAGKRYFDGLRMAGLPEE
ncbi:adenylate/guanylate cyclase domain-containing protein [Sulfitobacter sp. JB4-11]|uniref:adenylate/guanylate cyclase domain-containing protein n=1 Tax=Sulfitobacter rhodophyticola TaxID=3238304 RepID=UPI0035170D61